MIRTGQCRLENPPSMAKFEPFEPEIDHLFFYVMLFCDMVRFRVVSNRIDVFQRRFLERILKITCTDHVTNEEDLRGANMKPLQDKVAEKRLRFTEHQLLMVDGLH